MSFVANCQQENVKDTSLRLKWRAETYVFHKLRQSRKIRSKPEATKIRSGKISF